VEMSLPVQLIYANKNVKNKQQQQKKPKWSVIGLKHRSWNEQNPRNQEIFIAAGE
jgi:hypothetical protein